MNPKKSKKPFHMPWSKGKGTPEDGSSNLGAGGGLGNGQRKSRSSFDVSGGGKQSRASENFPEGSVLHNASIVAHPSCFDLRGENAFKFLNLKLLCNL